MDSELAPYSHEALSWTSRPKGTANEYSLRGYTWEQDPATGEWSSPTIAFDTFRVPAEGDAPYCSDWSQTWLAAPHHTWDSDYSGTEVALSEDEYTVCRDLLETWVVDNSVPLTTW